MNTVYEEFLNRLKSIKKTSGSTLVFLHGDLGSGKTTFVKNLCLYTNLNVEIHSPTFVILKAYEANILNFERFIHIDAYRLNSFDDLKKIKIDNYLEDEKNLIFIEWPDLVKSELLKPDIEVFFDHIFEKGDRKITLI
jgi:tRNA threonylcarbamoyladenosine biosynthesis protein TsaE